MRKPKASLPNHSAARTTLNQRKVDHLAACMDDSVDLANDSFARLCTSVFEAVELRLAPCR